jgi:hypothetical protein
MASSDRITSPMNEPKVGIGPSRPTIIAHRFWCPSCDAAAGEACRLSPKFSQEYSHVARHREAQRADWRSLTREMPVSTGWTVGSR